MIDGVEPGDTVALIRANGISGNEAVAKVQAITQRYSPAHYVLHVLLDDGGSRTFVRNCGARKDWTKKEKGHEQLGT